LTTLAIALAACGLSIREAADYFDVRPDTVQKCVNGKARTPQGWLRELKVLSDQIERSAQAGLEAIHKMAAEYYRPDTVMDVEIGTASDDIEAKALGFPCPGAHKAVAARIWARKPDGVEIIFVPRGLTPATAKAADVHDQIL
jgi:hypothetical protein